METKQNSALTQVSETPEMQKVMSILGKEIQRLDENISLLIQRLNPILITERPSEVGKDRERCSLQYSLNLLISLKRV